MSVAIICEDFDGMRAQALGLVERAGLKAHFHPIKIRGVWSSLPLRFCPYPLKAIDPISLSDSTGLLLSVGGSGGVVGVALRKKWKLPLVQIQNPRLNSRNFDLIIANYHDRLKGANLFEIRTALHGITSEKLERAAQAWRSRLKRPNHQLLSVLLGGANGRFRFNLPEAAALAKTLHQALGRPTLKIAMTPSRRTAPEVMDYLKASLPMDRCWIWDGRGENPYLGLLACAEAIAVTCDSVSMISEAVATSAPVYIIQLPGRSRRIAEFLDYLEARERVKNFSSDFVSWPVAPLDDTRLAAEKLLQYLASQGSRGSKQLNSG